MPEPDIVLPEPDIALPRERINILIVDDEPKNLTVLESVLNAPGYRLIRATSAEEAFMALIADEFALLILDVQMPGMTGFELAEMVKQRKKTAHVPIIFLTAYYNQDEHALEGYSTGAVDYLHKPVNAAMLRSKVAVFVELYRKSHELEISNKSLLDEVAVRRRVQEELHDLNETLEQRVKERTQALRENESRLRHAANAARLTYLELDPEKGEVRLAENFGSVMGYVSPHENHVARSANAELLLSHVVKQDRERVAAAIRQFAEGRPVAKLDYRVVGDDGIERWIESEWFVESAQAGPPGKGGQTGKDGQPPKSFVTNLDVTARRAAEQQLRASEERFRQLADSMPQMVWTARPDGHLDYYNARWYEFTGFVPGKAGAITDWDALLFHDDLEAFYSQWQTAIGSGDGYRAQYRLWDRHADRYRWYLGRALPVRDENNRIVKWIGTSTDIDEQKRSEESLRRANHSLEQFAFAASHDLQEPLRNVAVYSQLFLQRYAGSFDEEGAKYLGFIKEGAQRMSRLVSDLLAYTQVSGGGSDPCVTDAEKALTTVLRNLSQAIETSQAKITHDALPSVSVNETHLEQLLQNLIGNALKYRRDDRLPEVHISARREESRWHFIVQDNGIGIEPEYHELVFGLFKRLHGTGGKYSGTGIGLAICEKIVENYGCRIWVESKAGAGARFHFTVPAAA